MLDPMKILARLLCVEGLTGGEGLIMDAVAELAVELGFTPERSDDGLVIRLCGSEMGPRLLFCTHLDTVPAGKGWTSDPFAGTGEGEWLIGRGAVDARGQVAAMLLALAECREMGLPAGELVLALSIGEEGNHPSLPKLLARIGPVDAAIVGEPTQMQIATSQRGLMVLELQTEGEQLHAARSEGANAIHLLAEDIVTLSGLTFDRVHPRLGSVKLTPTRLASGLADNVSPPTAVAVLDVRSTPAYSHGEIAGILTAAVKGKIRVVADQWIPCETPEDHPLIAHAMRSLPDSACFASDAASDWAALQAAGIPAIKLGPGDPAFSHQANERISESQLKAGVEGYRRLAERYFSVVL